MKIAKKSRKKTHLVLQYHPLSSKNYSAFFLMYCKGRIVSSLVPLLSFQIYLRRFSFFPKNYDGMLKKTDRYSLLSVHHCRHHGQNFVNSHSSKCTRSKLKPIRCSGCEGFRRAVSFV